ncbi:hypothetical protein J2787_000677 [Chryseobacterium rhizosphaerae]|uniref:Uncharacterized protein n=1 Tax=Chryseobacterium rhizosphaerae TaxID=395937 RepID=A0AAE3Y7H3_9FLAO|nr:hypothetical protein [Chryseobacterium rhizosphaerae]MDR6525307.1 hypothetical protein [Chryseobacterium rhizosphaerae]
MKQEIKVPMTNLEIETLLVAGKKISSLGEELSKSLSKMLQPYENLKISVPEICKIDMSGISTKTGADYTGVNIGFPEDLDLTPTWKVRLEIDWGNLS